NAHLAQSWRSMGCAAPCPQPRRNDTQRTEEQGLAGTHRLRGCPLDRMVYSLCRRAVPSPSQGERMTKQERRRLAHAQAQEIVAKLRASNQRAARYGAPVVAEEQYHGL